VEGNDSYGVDLMSCRLLQEETLLKSERRCVICHVPLPRRFFLTISRRFHARCWIFRESDDLDTVRQYPRQPAEGGLSAITCCREIMVGLDNE